MILKILRVDDQNDLNKQRLLLEVTANGNLNDYAVVDNTYKDGKLSDLEKHYFSFPSCTVKKGDFVQLYTSAGNKLTVDNQGGTKTHKFYRGLKHSVWNQKDTAHLLKIVDTEDVSVK